MDIYPSVESSDSKRSKTCCGGGFTGVEIANIFLAYLDRYNRQRGVLEGRVVTVEEAEVSLSLVVQSILVTSPSGIPMLRPEKDAVVLCQELARRISGLSGHGEARVETILRRTTPGDARPPITIEGMPRDED